MKAILKSLFQQQILTQENAKDAIISIATENYHPTQVSAFITVFLLRPISTEELSGFREGLFELCQRINLSEYNPMDICGTGGDSKNTFNISTLASFVAAGAGIKIAKHGNYAVSSACGSSNILEYFGYKFSSSESLLKADIERAGICFLHAPLFHPALKKVAEIRNELGVKTFFNMLGPLIHPASPSKQLAGVYSMSLADHYSIILKKSDTDYAIVHSLDGYDEISLTGPFRIITKESDNILEPEKVGFKKIKPETILGGTSVKESAKVFQDILNGSGTMEQNEVVIANAAFAINCYHPVLSLPDSIETAREALLSKKALQVFKSLMN